MRLTVTIASLGLAGCWTAAQPAPAPLTNTSPAPHALLPAPVEHWTGTGEQFDDHSTWTIDLVFDTSRRRGEISGTIAYPSIGCSGELTREADRGDDLVLREHITNNAEHLCIDGGLMLIPRGGREDAFHWRWIDPATGEEGAEATLHRAR